MSYSSISKATSIAGMFIGAFWVYKNGMSPTDGSTFSIRTGGSIPAIVRACCVSAFRSPHRAAMNVPG
ncbi:MAG: hypothetical protein BWY05_01372 [Euryarchaeota archaeon ADurb.Bin165]|nr:MAG: hypothetical protein BWY05_01372 [Euryarchaeota archaeon ADurb.Bin165]